MSSLDRTLLTHLAGLSRIELDPSHEEKLLRNLQDILVHFEELNGIDTALVLPMTGGTLRENVLREDTPHVLPLGDFENLRRVFPEEQDGYLSVPNVLPKQP